MDANIILIDSKISDIRWLEKRLDEEPCLKIAFDLSDEAILDSSKVALWKCIVDRIRSYTKSDLRVIPPADESLNNVLKSIGFYDGEKKSEISEHGFTPLMKVRNDRNDFIDEICKSHLEHRGYAVSLMMELAPRLMELADNIHYHSGPEDESGEGYVLGHIDKDSIELCFVDIGCGFKGSYKRHGLFLEKKESEILEESMKELVSSRNTPVKRERGIGLYTVKQYLNSGNIGELKIISGGGLLLFNGKQMSTHEIRYTQGTSVSLKVGL